MKVETLSLIVGGLDNLRDEVAAEVEEKDREEKKQVVALFKEICLFAIEKVGARIISNNGFKRR